jgi:hypothetical protein
MEGIRAEENGRYAWLRLGPQAWAAVALLVVVAGAAGIVTFRGTTADLAPTGAARAGLNAGDIDLLPDADDDLNADEAWAIVRTLADEVNWGEADAHEAGIAPGPGWANRAALSLNAAELDELARLLETELERQKGV